MDFQSTIIVCPGGRAYREVVLRGAISLPVLDRSDRRPPRPCCPMAPANGCLFRPALVRAYLFTLNDSRLAASRRNPWSREDWVEYLADRLRGDAESENLLVQCNRGHGGLLEKARDIVLSLERCRDELGIPLAFGNTYRLADALCRFACDPVDEPPSFARY